MAQPVKNPAVAVTNKEILAEINLISQIQQIETRLAIQPKSLRFAQLADAYVSMGQYDDGIQICEEGLKNFPNYTTASLVLAKAHYLSGNKNKAREILEGFLHARPSHIAARKMLGDIALENDDVRAAVTHYRIALRLDPINRQIIQTLVDLKDRYQKIKDASQGEEEDEDVIRPRDRVQPASTTYTKSIKPTEPTTKELRLPTGKKDLTEEMEQVEDSIVASLMSEGTPTEPIRKTEVVPTPVEMKSTPVEPAKSTTQQTMPESSTSSSMVESVPSSVSVPPLTPAFTDAGGVAYFYSDEDLSFAQFKQRNELQRQGKAVVMDRAELDQLIAKASGRMVAPAVQEPPIRIEEKPPVTESKSPAWMNEEFEISEVRSTEQPVPTDDVVEEQTVDEEPLTREEQEVILSEVEVSYRDYLDLITDEEELLEALFDQDLQGTEEEEEPSPLVAEVTGRIPVAEDVLLSYDDYLDGLDDEELLAEAELGEEPLFSLGQYSAYLEESDEEIDFQTYAMVSGMDGELLRQLDLDVEPSVSYRDYLSGPLSEEQRAEAQFEPTVLVAPPTVAEAKDAGTPAPTVTPAAVEARTAETITAAVQAAPTTKEMVEEEEEEVIEDEEQIDPADVSMELVDQFASRGQFGAAYKVCRMLKLNNPTDAKIDRKILELKRLYVWSTQMVG